MKMPRVSSLPFLPAEHRKLVNWVKPGLGHCMPAEMSEENNGEWAVAPMRRFSECPSEIGIGMEFLKKWVSSPMEMSSPFRWECEDFADQAHALPLDWGAGEEAGNGPPRWQLELE